MTWTTFEHCCGARFRAAKPLLGETNTAWVLSQSIAAIERTVRMTMGSLAFRMLWLFYTQDEIEGTSSVIREGVMTR